MTVFETGRPSLAELGAVIIAGALHVTAELLFSEAVALRFSGAVVVGFVVYLLVRVRRAPDILRLWGMRRDNFRASILPHMAFALVGAGSIIALGAALDRLALPATFWLTLALYPLWGVAQQFALQNMLARNIEKLTPNSFVIAGVAALLFAASHYPRLELVGLTLVSGVLFTLIYRRYPNLWAVGIAHGVLGSLAIYIVLQEDPGAVIARFLSGGAP